MPQRPILGFIGVCICFQLIACKDLEDTFNSERRKEIDFEDPAIGTRFSVQDSQGTTYEIGFEQHLLKDLPESPLHIQATDVNNDGLIDLAILQPVEEGRNTLRSLGRISLLIKQDASSTDYLGPFTLSLEGARRQHALFNDLDQDGTPEFSILNIGDSDSNGGITLFEVNFPTTPSDFEANAFEDFWTATETDSISDEELIQTIETGQFPVFMIQEDLDQDGNMDIAWVDRIEDQLSVLWNQTESGDTTPSFDTTIPNFGEIPAECGVTPNNSDNIETYIVFHESCVGEDPIQMATGDWNQDGFPDFVILDNENDEIRLLLNVERTLNDDTAYRSFEAPRHADGTLKNIHAVGENPYGVIAGDWDNDGFDDFAVTSQSDQYVSFFYGTEGSADFERHDLGLELFPRQIASADLNQDGLPDFVISNASATSTGDLSIVLSTNQTERSERYVAGRIAVSDRRRGSRPSFVQIVDVNADGKLDIWVALPFEKQVSLLIQE